MLTSLFRPSVQADPGQSRILIGPVAIPTFYGAASAVCLKLLDLLGKKPKKVVFLDEPTDTESTFFICNEQ